MQRDRRGLHHFVVPWLDEFDLFQMPYGLSNGLDLLLDVGICIDRPTMPADCQELRMQSNRLSSANRSTVGA